MLSSLETTSIATYNKGEIQTPSHFGIAYNLGVTFGNSYRFLSQLILHKGNFDDEFPLILTLNKDFYADHYPEYFHELKGLSISTMISIDTLLSISHILSNVLKQQCTVTLSTDNATKYDQTFLTQNWDLDKNTLFYTLFQHYFSKTLYRINFNSYYSYIIIGIPFLYELPLLNEEGLSWGGMGTFLTTNTSRDIDNGSGISPYLLVRKTMMTCSTVSEVAGLWKNTTRSSHPSTLFNNWDYDTYAWCDTNGDILLIEQTHSFIKTVFDTPESLRSSNGILCHTNHHYFLDPYQTGSIIPGENYQSISSKMRLDRGWNLLQLFHGNITIDTCITITKDHDHGTTQNHSDSSDICRHADSNDSYQTVLSWIIESKQKRLYINHDQPCTSDYISYTYSDLFQDTLLKTSSIQLISTS